jgi:hypothetical protein
MLLCGDSLDLKIHDYKQSDSVLRIAKSCDDDAINGRRNMTAEPSMLTYRDCHDGLVMAPLAHRHLALHPAEMTTGYHCSDNRKVAL